MKRSTKGIAVELFLVVALCLSASASASEWIGCAGKTHSVDLLVDPIQRTVLGFGLVIHGVRQEAVSWDIVKSTLDPTTQTLTFDARERSTAPRQFTLTVQESSGRFRWHAPRPEPTLELSCFWGALGGQALIAGFA